MGLFSESTASTAIMIDGMAIAVTMYHEDRGVVCGRIMEATPQPIAAWPLTADEITALTEAQYRAFHCRADREDIVWAIGKASDLWMGDGPWFFRAVQTVAEEAANRRAARDEAADGLV